MDKRSEPIGVRFRNSVLDAIKNIALHEDKPFSEILDQLLDEALFHRTYKYPFCKKCTEENGNGQGNAGSTL